MQEHDAAFLQRHQSLDLDASEPDPAA